MDYRLIGFLAGAITSAAFVPQIIKALATKKVADLALLQPVFLSVGIFLWLVYGLILKDTPIILANSFSLICNLWLVVLKIIYRSR